MRYTINHAPSRSTILFEGNILYCSYGCDLEKCIFPTEAIQVCKTCPFKIEL